MIVHLFKAAYRMQWRLFEFEFEFEFANGGSGDLIIEFWVFFMVYIKSSCIENENAKWGRMNCWKWKMSFRWRAQKEILQENVGEQGQWIERKHWRCVLWLRHKPGLIRGHMCTGNIILLPIYTSKFLTPSSLVVGKCADIGFVTGRLRVRIRQVTQ